MPFLPLVLLIAWQALARSASFALGWATALFFGQVPGNRGYLLSVMALIAVAWVALLVGFGLPLGIGFAAERVGWVPRNFAIDPFQVWALVGAIGLAPPTLAAVAEFAAFDDDRSLLGWLRRLPVSYPATASLGVSVLLMLIIAPFLVVSRVRRNHRLVQVPLVMQEDGSADGLSRPIVDALRSLQIGAFERRRLEGPRSWPLRTTGYAARHLLGRMVHTDPVLISGEHLQVVVYATNVGILGPEQEAYPARAAIEKRLAFTRAYLSWSPQSQSFEDELRQLYEQRDGRDGHDGRDGRESLDRQLERLQARIDAAPLASDEWNLLYRLRLQVEREATVNRGAVEREAVVSG